MRKSLGILFFFITRVLSTFGGDKNVNNSGVYLRVCHVFTRAHTCATTLSTNYAAMMRIEITQTTHCVRRTAYLS